MRTPWIAGVLCGLAILSVGLKDAGAQFTPTSVFEYHNALLDHYFMATQYEAPLLDAGEAGPGWQRTGHVFTVESVGYPFYGRPICRFYGSMSPGPNSHFFTPQGAECDFLKQLQASTPVSQPRWNFEGLTFPAGRYENGACRDFSYGVPVQRLYNNGAARGIDSNHRHTTDPQVVAEMQRQGWVLEGTAFCVRNAGVSPR